MQPGPQSAEAEDGQPSYSGADSNFDPAYGARHLQRNIERLFLGLIAQANRKTLSFGVVDGERVIVVHDYGVTTAQGG